MNRVQEIQRGRAGTSMTKACVYRRAATAPVAFSHWNKLTDAGFTA